MIYLTRRLPQPTMSFELQDREGVACTVKISSTGTKIEMTDTSAMQIFNLILRRAMEGLEMTLVGRDFYYPAKRVTNFQLIKAFILIEI